MAKQYNLFNQSKTPEWPTFVKQRFPDGRVQNVDNQMWLYYTVPMGLVSDARTPADSLLPGNVLLDAFGEVSSLSGPIRLTRRRTAKSAYRDTHLLLVNVPQLFVPKQHAKLHDMHAMMFPHTQTYRRVALLGARLLPKFEDRSFLAGVEDVVETFISGGDPVSSFNRDWHDMAAAFSRSGLRTPTDEEMRLCDAWWNGGMDALVPQLVHTDHLHIFRSVDAARSAKRLSEDTSMTCDQWPVTNDSHTISFATAREFDVDFEEVVDERCRWMTRLINNGALAISVRAKVEPARVTRDELRRMRSRYLSDINDMASSGKMERFEQEQTLQNLADMESFYAAGGTPTLMEASTVVAFSGRSEATGYDPSDIGRASGVALSNMVNVQDRALAEMMIGSSVRANPFVRDLPSQMVAYSGAPNLGLVGDGDGALLGFTEQDRQPVFMNPTEAVNADTLPIFVAVGQTGSGKSMLMTWLVYQFGRIITTRGERTPVVVFDPKRGSDFSPIADHVFSMDDLIAADGALDALGFAKDPADGIEQAHAAIMAVNPWGETNARRYEAELLQALSYGVRQAGAKSTMMALEAALNAGQASKEMVDGVRRLRESSPEFAALCGRSESRSALRMAEGVTYIRMGDRDLSLPSPGTPNSEMSLVQRVSVQLVRSVVYGSMAALDGRQGVLALDEGWVFTSAGRAEMERLGRVARSMTIFPMLFTQRVTDALNAGLEGYISRCGVLPITDQAEAVAACKLAGVTPTPELISRIRASAVRGDAEVGEPNPESMRALYLTDPNDPKKRELLRGTIMLLSDIRGRVVPVEVTIPPKFLRLVTTNLLDRERYAKERELAAGGGVMPW